VSPRARKGDAGRVDWAEIHRRVDAAGRVLAGAVEPEPERAQAVLDERARALARSAAPPATEGRLETVTFLLANERYAVESRYVIEVFRLRDLSPLPGAEPPVTGVTAWRGDLLQVLDLRPVLGLPVTALNDLSRVVVLGTARPAFGVLVDAVESIVTIPASRLLAPQDGPAARREYLRGITADAILVLDAERVLRFSDS
jgi:purine-binding chemotaxis protein CheW